MVRGITLFICSKCKKIFLAPDVEYGATAFSMPMPCGRSGSRRTLPLLDYLTGYSIYKKIWDGIEQEQNNQNRKENDENR